MSTPRRRLVTTLAAASAAVMIAGPAFAHPSFNPNVITPLERHTLDLVIPHGCAASGGAPDAGEATSPTLSLAVQVPSGDLNFIAGREVDGWTLTTSATAMTWVDNGGATTDPITFQMDLEVKEGVENLWFTIAQDCEQGSSLWIAQPDRPDEGDGPAALLTIGGAVSSVEVDTSHGEHAEGEGDGAEHTDGDDAEHTDGEVAEGEHAEDGDHDAAPAAAASLDPSLVVVVLLLVVGGIAGILKMD